MMYFMYICIMRQGNDDFIARRQSSQKKLHNSRHTTESSVYGCAMCVLCVCVKSFIHILQTHIRIVYIARASEETRLFISRFHIQNHSHKMFNQYKFTISVSPTHTYTHAATPQTHKHNE